MATKNKTCIAAAIFLVVLLSVIFIVRVPFISWNSGRTINLLGAQGNTSTVQISGIATSHTSGQILLSTVAGTQQNQSLTLPRALAAYLLPSHTVLPESWVNPANSAAANSGMGTDAAAEAKHDAATAALREVGLPIEQNPVVESVSSGGPAYELLQVGDVINTVNSVGVTTDYEVQQIVQSQKVGATIQFGIQRNGNPLSVSVTTRSSVSDHSVPSIDVVVGQNYSFSPTVNFSVDTGIDVSNDGLMLALAVYDMVSPDDITQGHVVAGTGTIDSMGAVGPSTGIEEKINGAKQAGASVFFVPAANCSEVSELKTSMNMVKVNKLDDVISALQAINRGDQTQIPRC